MHLQRLIIEKKNLILNKSPTQALEHTLSAEKKKCIQLILLKIIKKPVSAHIIMEQTVIYLLMV